MDIRLTLEALGYLDKGEDPAPDLHSYDAMAATWRDPRPVPSLADMEAAWPAVAAQQSALAEIARLEGEVTQRRIREALTTQDGADWLAAQEALIAAERAKL